MTDHEIMKPEKPALKHTPRIPDLRIVPTDAVLPHEEHDRQRSEPLLARIRDSGVWLNPPIVTPIHDDPQRGEFEMRYALLDGANRHFCLQELAIPHILVQMVEFGTEEVSLETWDHVLSNVNMQTILRQVRDIDGLDVLETTHDKAEAAIADGTAAAYIRVLPDHILAVIEENNDPIYRTFKLRELVDTYKTIAKIDRFNGDHPDVVKLLHPHAVAVVVFAPFQPEDIIRAARDQIFIPAGLSRHIIQGRAMRLHYPLAALRDTDKTLEEKNADLLAWMQVQVSERRMRLYAEATFLFDD
jgi:hypothetical protein